MARNSPYELLPGNGANIADYPNMFKQPDSMKDCKDLSKNLVCGDLEREYQKSVIMDKPPKKSRQLCFGLLAVLMAGMAAWLLGLTLIREMQLSQLRKDIDKLKTDVNVLQQKASERDLINEVKVFEDGIYADIDQDVDSSGIDDNFDRNSDKPKLSASEKATLDQLDSITVIDDVADDDDDEDENYDDEDGESGDWYLDYDKRRENKVGTTNMVKLTPEDLGKIRKTGQHVEQSLPSKISELRKILHQEPRPLEASATNRPKRSVEADTFEDAVDSFAAPRHYKMKVSDDRRKSKKYVVPDFGAEAQERFPELDLPRLQMARHENGRHMLRTVRNSDNEEGEARRPFVAAHFHGNTSHLSTELHEHYKGNGLVRTAHGAAHDVWWPARWTQAVPAPRPTLTRAGHVHVHSAGVYFVYVQIYYLDAHDVTGWVLHRSGGGGDGEREALLQCARTSPSTEPRDKPNSCFSAAALQLRAGDRLAVRNTGGDRHALMQPEKSFVGLVKLADADDAEDEF